jgi:DNA polymerase-3 subunit delta
MKISAKQVGSFLNSPDSCAKLKGILVYGSDVNAVQNCYNRIVSGVFADHTRDDSRYEIHMIDKGNLKKNPAQLENALLGMSFWKNHRVVIIENVIESLVPIISAALDRIPPDDSILVVTAGALSPSSSLRLLFEKCTGAVALPCYENTCQRFSMDLLRSLGINDICSDAYKILESIATTQDEGIFLQDCKKLALYTDGLEHPISVEDIIACDVAQGDVLVQGLVDFVIRGKIAVIPQTFQRVERQGITYDQILSTLQWRLRNIYTSQVAQENEIPSLINTNREKSTTDIQNTIADKVKIWNISELEVAQSLVWNTVSALRGDVVASKISYAYVEDVLLRISRIKAD